MQLDVIKLQPVLLLVDSVPNCACCGNVHKGNANKGVFDVLPFESY